MSKVTCSILTGLKGEVDAEEEKEAIAPHEKKKSSAIKPPMSTRCASLALLACVLVHYYYGGSSVPAAPTHLEGHRVTVVTADESMDPEDRMKQASVIMDLTPYFREMKRHKAKGKIDNKPRLVGGAATRAAAGGESSSTSPLMGDAQFTDSAKGMRSYNGAEVHQLPVADQALCGSCWAWASSTALKANLKLSTFGMAENELPNLNMLISCSDRTHQVVVTRNSQPKWMIELSKTRPYGAGCEGGLTGMALAQLQIEKSIHATDIDLYTSGHVGDLGVGPATTQPNYNVPGQSCEEYRTARRKHGAYPTLSVPHDIGKLDVTHLIRRTANRGIYFPSPRDIRNFLVTHGAAIIYVDTDTGHLDSTELQHTDVAVLPPCPWKPSEFMQTEDSMRSVSLFANADHAITLVGFDCDKKAWLVQNSWGKSWGKGGRLYLYDENVCNDSLSALSAHSGGAGPACMFASSLSAFRP